MGSQAVVAHKMTQSCRICSIAASTDSPADRKSSRGRLWTAPKLTLPLALFAIGAAFISPVSAAQSGFAPAAFTEAPLTMSTRALNLEDVPIAIATAAPEPLMHEAPELRFKRANEGSSKSDGTKTSIADPSSSVSRSPLPSPFDSPEPALFQLPGDQSDSCPKFMSNLLGDATFKSCYPISMLIQVRGFLFTFIFPP